VRRRIIWKIKSIFNCIYWILRGKPMVQYRGYECVTCKNWIGEPINIPDYISLGKLYDTWGICAICRDAFRMPHAIPPNALDKDFPV
jgi:hypothetical protein